MFNSIYAHLNRTGLLLTAPKLWPKRVWHDCACKASTHEEVVLKTTCMCGSDVAHSPWEGHQPVSMWDYYNNG